MFSLNGNGEMTGTHWVEESGFLEGPVMLTNTHSVGIVRDAVIQWRIRPGTPDPSGYWWSLPVVAETWDGDLNDINGFHVQARARVRRARERARRRDRRRQCRRRHRHDLPRVQVRHGHELAHGQHRQTSAYVVGALVQANYGVRGELRIAGVPGRQTYAGRTAPRVEPAKDQGSIIIVVATDAPLLPHQLKRLARRAAMGLARNGSYAGNGSGDIFIAFSTANDAASQVATATLRALGNEQLDPLFLATVQAVEESIINSMIAAQTMTGVNGDTRGRRSITAELQRILRQYGRLNQ